MIRWRHATTLLLALSQNDGSDASDFSAVGIFIENDTFGRAFAFCFLDQEAILLGECPQWKSTQSSPTRAISTHYWHLHCRSIA